MNKSLISILLVVFFAVISGCADTGSGGGTNSGGGTGSGGGTSSGGGTGSGDGNGNSNTPSYDISSIPVDETIIELTKSSGEDVESTEPKAVTITNPRKDKGEYYPILISTAMGLNGEVDLSYFDFGIVKGIAYETKFGSNSQSSKLVFGEGKDMYDLNGETALKENGKGIYYVWITSGYSMPSEGKLVIAFLTKEEAKKHIPNNDNIVLQPVGETIETMTYNPKFLDNTIVDELNKLGALRQYNFTVK